MRIVFDFVRLWSRQVLNSPSYNVLVIMLTHLHDPMTVHKGRQERSRLGGVHRNLSVAARAARYPKAGQRHRG
jgi:hypothetical protein